MIDLRGLLHRCRPAARVAALATFAALVLPGTAQSALVIDYSGGFANACGNTLTCVPDAGEVGAVLQVTPGLVGQAGAAYSQTTIGVNGTFSTRFQFQLLAGEYSDEHDSNYGLSPADGIVFIIAASDAQLGQGGGGMGYQGVSNSVGIEFDIFHNGAGEGDTDNFNNNHVAVNIGGNISSPIAFANPYGETDCQYATQAEANARPACMSNGLVWTVEIKYDGSTNLLTVQIDNGSGPQMLISTSYDIGAELGTTDAFVGFTGGTGSGWADQRILNWVLTDDTILPPPPAAVPLPGTIGLLGVGLAAVGFAAGRRRSSAAARV